MSDTPSPPPPPAGGPPLKGGIDCRTALEQLWEYLDGELSPERMDAVRTHMALCAKCYPEYNLEKAFLDAVGTCRKGQCASHKLKTRILDTLQRLGFSPARSSSA
jgi:anti-sigma factor (TIGR02949 family)